MTNCFTYHISKGVIATTKDHNFRLDSKEVTVLTTATGQGVNKGGIVKLVHTIKNFRLGVEIF